MIREDGRSLDQLREVKVTTGFTIHAEGSVLIEMGATKVICTASVNESVPRFLKKTGKGWLNAEYSMLPRATQDRNMRESARGKLGGRTMEIQRLIGRSLRSAIDFKKLGERTITIDCDVIQADGGTRTASITGGYIALELAIKKLLKEEVLTENPLTGRVAAISVGIVEGNSMLDLMYTEDSVADVDMNLVMTSNQEFVEIQGTGEETTYNRKELNEMLDLGEKGINRLFEIQEEATRG